MAHARVKQPAPPEEHMIMVQQGDQIFAKCGRGFSKKAKTDHGTFWWKLVTCEGCIDAICTNQTTIDFFNSKEPVW
jgi:hypothetical protein